MKDRNGNRSIKSSTLGFLLGSAAGFALGLLLAPEEGKKIRSKLAYQLDHLSQQVADLIDKSLSPEEEGAARRDGDALVADAQEKAEQIRTDIDALLGEIKQDQ